ncbi:30S ribosome-binding factor RbfA [Ruminococcaceae bacterium OttesenSCG-928-L11]|nr:30S ribosome-binding factor RbfA [Ruminococcaceae bacterium OttesenSCG-928-L11]
MPSFKTARNAEDIKRELTDIFRSLKDPRVTGMLSIVSLDLSGDGSWCKVYVSSLEGLETAQNAVKGLTSAAGFIRREIGLRLKMRHTPQFLFIADDGIAHSAEINKKLRDL